MAWYPKAVHRKLPEADSQGFYDKKLIVLHTAVANVRSLYPYWTSPNVGLESTFFVARDGTVEQYTDSSARADANYKLNREGISIETQDNQPADAQHLEAWAPAQLDAIVDLVRWCCETHEIPKRMATSPYDSGICWHAQFGAPSALTPSRGKVCPGWRRIEQVPEILRRVIATSGNYQPKGNLLMALSDAEQSKLAADARESRLVLAQLQDLLTDKEDGGSGEGFALDRLRDSLARLEVEVEKIKKAVSRR